jgi:paired amphipathic helix protein Sin3a
MCNEIGAKLAAQKHASFHENPIAVELGLDDPYGPSAVLAQEIDAIGDRETAESTNVTYLYLLDACEKVFDNELDQATFEEHMRWFFGNKVGFLYNDAIKCLIGFRLRRTTFSH